MGRVHFVCESKVIVRRVVVGGSIDYVIVTGRDETSGEPLGGLSSISIENRLNRTC